MNIIEYLIKFVWVYIRVLSRDVRQLFRMCKKALDHSHPQEWQDRVLIMGAMLLILAPSPFILICTAYQKTRRILRIYDPERDSCEDE